MLAVYSHVRDFSFQGLRVGAAFFQCLAQSFRQYDVWLRTQGFKFLTGSTCKAPTYMPLRFGVLSPSLETAARRPECGLNAPTLKLGQHGVTKILPQNRKK